MIRKRLADMAGLDPGDLPGFAPPREAARSRPAVAARLVRRAHSVEAQVLQRVLRQPGLANGVDPDLMADDSAEGRALHAVLAFAREAPANLTLGQVMAHFEGTDHAPALEAALGGGSVLDEVPEADLDLEAELQGLQERLRQQRSELRKAELEARSMAGGLTEAERAEWTELQARQALAKGVNSTLEKSPKR
jgi:hypothetical protein